VSEHALAGGNVAAAVVRVGDTVRKPAGFWTPAVEALLAFLEARGFSGAPRPLGRDDQGRQVLEYVPGPMAIDQPPLDASGLRRVGRLIRDLHDASAGFEPPSPSPPGARWNVAIPPDRTDLVCHHDLAPWNLVTGAHPGHGRSARERRPHRRAALGPPARRGARHLLDRLRRLYRPPSSHLAASARLNVGSVSPQPGPKRSADRLIRKRSQPFAIMEPSGNYADRETSMGSRRKQLRAERYLMPLLINADAARGLGGTQGT
jgi:hypothetical protein